MRSVAAEQLEWYGVNGTVLSREKGFGGVVETSADLWAPNAAEGSRWSCNASSSSSPFRFLFSEVHLLPRVPVQPELDQAPLLVVRHGSHSRLSLLSLLARDPWAPMQVTKKMPNLKSREHRPFLVDQEDRPIDRRSMEICVKTASRSGSE